MEQLQKIALKIFGLQNCNYLKSDLPSRRPLTSRSGSMIRLTSIPLDERPSLTQRHRSVSQNCVTSLTTGCLDFADNFDLSALNYAVRKLNKISTKMELKWSFLQELEVCKSDYQLLKIFFRKCYFLQQEKRKSKCVKMRFKLWHKFRRNLMRRLDFNEHSYSSRIGNNLIYFKFFVGESSSKKKCRNQTFL